MIGAPRAAALAIRLASDDASLDAAVAQTRGLLDRIRQGALRDEDLVRATRAIGRAQLSASLDPRTRTLSLWRDAAPQQAPLLEALRAFAAGALHDDALVIVAARPPRSDARNPTRGR